MIPIKRKTWIGIVFFSLCGVAAIMGLIIWNKPHRNVEDEAGIHVTAIQLVKEYAVDEDLANQKYLDKVIAVSGLVYKISKNQEGEPTVSLQSGEILSCVYCTLKKDVQSPSKGSPVVVKGICTGKLSDVVVIDAVIENVR